jgi:hypothetical protein
MWSVNKIKSTGGMTISRGKKSTQRKPSLIATLSTTNQTWNDLGNKEESFTFFFLLSEFTVSENNFSQNDINNVIYHETFHNVP